MTLLNLLYLLIGLVGVNALLLLLIATLIVVGLLTSLLKGCARMTAADLVATYNAAPAAIAADNVKLAADQATVVTDTAAVDTDTAALAADAAAIASLVASVGPFAIVSPDGDTVSIYGPAPASPGFTVTVIPTGAHVPVP